MGNRKTSKNTLSHEFPVTQRVSDDRETRRILGGCPGLPINGPVPGSFRPRTRWFPHRIADLSTFGVIVPSSSAL